MGVDECDTAPGTSVPVSNSVVSEGTGSTLTAGITGTFGLLVAGVRQQFTTVNTLVADESIEMRLLEGPFRNLQGQWRFAQLGQDGCKISLELDFEMNNAVVSKMFGRGFGKVADRLVDDFCKRAEKVYPL